VATTEAAPLQTPLHVTFVCVGVNVICGGCVMFTVTCPVHPAAPVTVQVYVPAHKPEAVAAVPPEGAHAYVYGPPPNAVTVAEPVQTL
jgi:hypothetical protein